MYKVIQLTDQTVGAVAPGALMPLGNITRRYGCTCNRGGQTFEVSTSGSDTITIFEDGYYHLTYVGSLTAGAVGEIILNLLINGAEIISSAETVTAVGDTANITIHYVIRVLPNCCSVVVNNPAIVQIQLDADSVALTGGTSNIVIEKVR